jgi:hypothetical protein
LGPHCVLHQLALAVSSLPPLSSNREPQAVVKPMPERLGLGCGLSLIPARWQ